MATKKVINSALSEIKKGITQIEEIVRQMHKEINEHDADVTRSGNYKLEQNNASRAAALEKVQTVGDSLEQYIETLREETETLFSFFDYGDPRLFAAMNFIKAEGNDIPEGVTAQIVRDFQGKPAALRYILQQLEKMHVLDGAADEGRQLVREYEKAAEFPKTIDDRIYYLFTAGGAVNHSEVSLEGTFADLRDKISGLSQILCKRQIRCRTESEYLMAAAALSDAA